VAHEIPAEWLPVRCETKRPARAIGPGRPLRSLNKPLQELLGRTPIIIIIIIIILFGVKKKPAYIH